MLVYKLKGDFSLPFYVFIKLFLIMVLCTRCLYTSVWAMFVDRYMCSSNCFSGSGCAREACIQASGRCLWTVICAHKSISLEVVVHEKLVYKRLGDVCGPWYVLIKLFLRKRLCTWGLWCAMVLLVAAAVLLISFLQPLLLLLPSPPLWGCGLVPSLWWWWWFVSCVGHVF